jgi:hypothetical protein
MSNNGIGSILHKNGSQPVTFEQLMVTPPKNNPGGQHPEQHQFQSGSKKSTPLQPNLLDSSSFETPQMH